MKRSVRISKKTAPGSRPFRLHAAEELLIRFRESLKTEDGLTGAHCIHECWMRGEMAINIESMLKRLWDSCGESIPDWLPMRHVEWLPQAYEIAARFNATGKGRSNIYLVLLDYSDSRQEPFGVYVGMSEYSAAERFDQHKAGIRAAGSVLKRGVESLTGPTLHLQKMRRAEAEKIEGELAEALAAAGLFVQGGH